MEPSAPGSARRPVTAGGVVSVALRTDAAAPLPTVFSPRSSKVYSVLAARSVVVTSLIE